MANKKTIEPRTLKGFRDFLPEEQIARQKIIDIIRKSYELFGFSPLETPALEYAEILSGKYSDEADKQMYQFKDNGDREVGMRYDFTVPLARLVAQNGEIKKPFKRYQVGPLWRAENTQKGRYREFYQSDADIVGLGSVNADAEILALSAYTFRALGVTDFVIRINSRQILSAFYKKIGLDEKRMTPVIRAVDKLDKMGEAGVLQELKDGGVPKELAEQILSFAKVRAGSVSALLAYGKDFGIYDAVADFSQIIQAALSIDSQLPFVVDFSIARGSDYYTGLIFEGQLLKAPQYGAVMAGGRYDNLIGMFANKSVPAVGTSIGVDRLFAALDDLKLIKRESTVTKVLVANFDEKLGAKYAETVSLLRQSGINTEFYFETVDLKKQLSYASDRAIPFVIIIGSKEAESSKVTLKNMMSGEQQSLDIKEVVKMLL